MNDGVLRVMLSTADIENGPVLGSCDGIDSIGHVRCKALGDA